MHACPHCQQELALVDYRDTGQLEYGGNIKRNEWWPMQDRDREFQCPECHHPLDAEDLDSLGVPNQFR